MAKKRAPRRKTVTPPAPKDEEPAQKKKGAKKAPARARKASGSTAKDPEATQEDPRAAPRPVESKAEQSFPIVGVGASAGGLEALEELFADMPPQTGIAFVVVTHQHPGRQSLLPELLARSTKVPVVEVTDGLRVEPDHIYVGQPGGQLAILDGVLHRMEIESPQAPRLPIDYFLRSLAEDQNERAIAIILSGTGTDGTLGVKAIKGQSGMVMVEEPQAAKYAGMPSSAIATGLADYVLPPAAMPRQLIAYTTGSYLQRAGRIEEEGWLSTEPMQKILVLMRNRTGHDFSSYKESTLRRRIERRMNVHQIEEAGTYVRYLQENPQELNVLFQELLICVTSFFRDPEAWDALVQGPLRELLRSRPERYTLQVWVPGCATGEEAYSLAIVLRESLEKIDRALEAQIFATDLDASAIQVGRSGRYPAGISADVSPSRLSRHFSREDDDWRVRKSIREMVVFACQNLIKDPPFTRLDLVSCRNLLIYFKPELQRRLLGIFHYALKPGGLLFLGPSETVGRLTDLFEPLDRRWKIFRRQETAARPHAVPGLTFEQEAEQLGEKAEVATKDGTCYLMRIAPYRTAENLIDGLVLTFVNVDQLKRAHGAREARDVLRGFVDEQSRPVLVLDDHLHALWANRLFIDLLGLDDEEIEGRTLEEIADGILDVPELRDRLQEAVSETEELRSLEIAADLPGKGSVTITLRGQVLRLKGDDSRRLLLIVESIQPAGDGQSDGP